MLVRAGWRDEIKNSRVGCRIQEANNSTSLKAQRQSDTLKSKENAS